MGRTRSLCHLGGLDAFMYTVCTTLAIGLSSSR